MPTNDFLPIGTDPAANVDTQATFVSWLQRTTGFVSGIAPSKTFNKVFRQASMTGAFIGQTIIDMIGADHPDDGNLANATARFKLAIGKLTRIKLFANLTLFVSPTGNDANPGTSLLPFLTLQAVWNTLVNSYDLNGFNVTVNIANGTYTGGLVASGSILGLGSGNTIQFIGNTASPSSVLINTTNANCIQNSGNTIYVSGMKFQATGTTSSGNAASAIFASGASVGINGAVQFGTCSGYHLWATQSGQIQFTAAYSIVGGAQSHYVTSANAYIQSNGALTITLTGTPAFSVAFAQASLQSTIVVPGLTFSGAATGARYSAIHNSIINTNAAGATYLPGSTAGAIASQGQYL